MSTPYVYLFGTSRTDGAASMKNLLGGKGANLAEMCRLGITVPSGFTISTEACTVFTEQGKDAARWRRQSARRRRKQRCRAVLAEKYRRR